MGIGLRGLTAAEVAERIASGDVNREAGKKTRTIPQIFYENICTLFNAVNVILALFVLITGSYRNMLFMLVIICNVAIGIIQEIRSKQTTDRLSIVAGNKACVVRDRERVQLPLDQIVRDDVLELGRGDQIPTDCVVVDGDCRVDESLLTGESDLIKKRPGDTLMSGSFVNSGLVLARVVHVGDENYAAQISTAAKQRKEINSEIMKSLKGIIRFVSCIIFPLGLLLFSREYFISATPLNDAILSTVSALVGMIPEGLILLTSTVLAVAVVRLAQSQVLVQQLYCIETLARVDTLCLDKTGTITTGAMEVEATHVFPGASASDMDAAFSAISNADEDPNETAQAIIEYYRGKGSAASSESAASPTAGPTVESAAPAGLVQVIRSIPFSSDKKWSGCACADGRAFVMGAAQFVMGEAFPQVEAQLNELSGDSRVLLAAAVDGFDADGNALGSPRPLGFICIHDQIRATAAQTIEYFKEQGVTLKVISGDDPHTVSSIAAKVGIPGADNFVDATTLQTNAAIDEAVKKYSVFGRVKPEQKKAFVEALQAQGHVVAMTGDGVNDTLALKTSDCGVAMASGSDAARGVAQLVLVNNDFASMPKVVAEGRRSINNLQRSASLFLVKTLLSMTLAIIFIFLPWEYPFQPIQMTLISTFTIGIPSFVLALEPNHERIRGRFLDNVIVKSIPGAACGVLAVLVTSFVGYQVLGADYGQVSTMCVLLCAWVGIQLVIRLSLPLTPIRVALLVVVIGGTIFGAVVLHTFFGIQPFSVGMAILATSEAVFFALAFHISYGIVDARHSAKLDRLP